MSASRKFLILAPYWHSPGHVGSYRVDRFIRWLHAIDIPVVLVCAGAEEGEKSTPWGYEVTVRDPLNLYGTRNAEGQHQPVNRRPNPLRRWVAEWVFNPDLPIVWTKRVTRHPLIQAHMTDVTDILASSPPDSIHVGAEILATRYGKSLIVDRRDGWLDEPLKPLLQRSRLRRYLEGRHERKVLQKATTIFVTSEVWKEHLAKRHPDVVQNTTVLTNAYPELRSMKVSETDVLSADGKNDGINLIHAGRFTGSNSRQRPRLLLSPLLSAVSDFAGSGSILCLGGLETADFEEINPFIDPLAQQGWTLETRNSVPREELMQIMSGMHGLLLLSTPFASIPSKFFEYLAMGRPMLAVTRAGSAIWRIGQQLPQVFLIDLDQSNNHAAAIDFIDSCRRNEQFPAPPETYSEAFLSRIFVNALNLQS